MIARLVHLPTRVPAEQRRDERWWRRLVEGFSLRVQSRSWRLACSRGLEHYRSRREGRK